MLIAGGVLGLVITLLPQSDHGGDMQVVVLSVIALLLGALLAARPYLAPQWMTPVFVAFGAALVTAPP